MKNIYFSFLFLLGISLLSCSHRDEKNPNDLKGKKDAVIEAEEMAAYNSIQNLVMTGYQGWFSAAGDESKRGWYHYKNTNCGGFHPGCSSVDFWPDITDEYVKTYPSPFHFEDGSTAPLFSSYDKETVDLHFKWMQDYGIDGAYIQRFIVEVKPENAEGKRHFDQVLRNALKAAKKYNRAISIMYDLSGCTSEEVLLVEQDWAELVKAYKLDDLTQNPTYLHHNGKPLVSIWGVGFNDNRKYSIGDVEKLVETLKSEHHQLSLLLGVPYFWRTLDRDTENSPALHSLIKRVDAILPWAVGRYNLETYETVSSGLKEDLEWSSKNKVDYIALAFPGFTWGNLRNDERLYNAIPREEGKFYWKQIAGAKLAGSKSLYLAMFDELDEGTAIFKTALQSEVPLNGDQGLKFMGIEEGLSSDHYLWLSGEAAKWFHGEENYGLEVPKRP